MEPDNPFVIDVAIPRCGMDDDQRGWVAAILHAGLTVQLRAPTPEALQDAVGGLQMELVECVGSA